jgi:hypothetical protein
MYSLSLDRNVQCSSNGAICVIAETDVTLHYSTFCMPTALIGPKTGYADHTATRLHTISSLLLYQV